jgi:chemotaxis family two-component system response regulator Rcp1
VLLDLNLPGMGGLEFLGWIKSTPVLRRFPVIVQPAASHPDDVRNAYDNGASGYLVKPIDMDRFIKAIRAFEDF